MKTFAINENMYFIGDRDPPKRINKVVLYFPHYEFMHFGDHLFFEPLARFFKSKNIDIKIKPVEQMEFYFLDVGYQIATLDDIKKADLIITRAEFYTDVKRWPNKKILLINSSSTKIRQYLCKDIVDKVARFLSLDSENFIAKPARLKNHPENINLDSSYNYVIFNNYIDSGYQRLIKRDYLKLQNFARNFAEEHNLKVIHTGTQKEKDKDKNTYDFVNLDLRGKTSPADLFFLASHNKVKFNISFDALFMHIFSIYGKKSFVLNRERFSRAKREHFIKNYVNPPFDPKPFTTDDLIEYI